MSKLGYPTKVTLGFHTQPVKFINFRQQCFIIQFLVIRRNFVDAVIDVDVFGCFEVPTELMVHVTEPTLYFADFPRNLTI